jgi:hypothetical protein
MVIKWISKFHAAPRDHSFLHFIYYFQMLPSINDIVRATLSQRALFVIHFPGALIS